MYVKKRWISTAIVLTVYLFGFSNARAVADAKDGYQQKSPKVPVKKANSKVASNNAGNTPVYNQSRRGAVDLSALTYHTTFSEAIDILRHSTEPPLKIVV